MDNAEAGGNRGNFAENAGNFGTSEVFGTPESFEHAFETKQNIGELAVEAMGDAPDSVSEVAPEKSKFDESTDWVNEIIAKAEANQAKNNGIEQRTLAEDGSTEGKIGKLAVKLSGDLMSEEDAKEVEKAIAEKGADLNSLDTYRNEKMVHSLLGTFGRIFGNDDVGEIQAEEHKREQENAA